MTSISQSQTPRLLVSSFDLLRPPSSVPSRSADSHRQIRTATHLSPRTCVGEEATASASGQTNAQTEKAMTGAFVYVPHSTSHIQIQKKGKARTHSTTQTQNTKQNNTKQYRCGRCLEELGPAYGPVLSGALFGAGTMERKKGRHKYRLNLPHHNNDGIPLKM